MVCYFNKISPEYKVVNTSSDKLMLANGINLIEIQSNTNTRSLFRERKIVNELTWEGFDCIGHSVV